MSNTKYHYFNLEHAIREHEFIIDQSGGLPGIKSAGTIDSILHHIQNDEYYPEFLDKITHLVFSLNKSHAFNDGNKRTSLALSCFFLALNGHDFAIRQYTHGMEEVLIWVAKSLIDKHTLKAIIEFLLYDDSPHVAYFIEQAKLYREYIEPENAPIDEPLLTRMVGDWLSDGMELRDETLFELLEVLSLRYEQAQN